MPDFSYWQSSRVIPFTIHEFPFWSFLFADLHPHVIAMPLSLLMLGLIASFFLSRKGESEAQPKRQFSHLLFYPVVSFVFGAIACVNPWDMPVYAVLLGAAL